MSDWRDTYNSHDLMQSNHDKGPISWQNIDAMPQQQASRGDQLAWNAEEAPYGIASSGDQFGRAASMGERNMDASALSNEELFSAIVRMDVPPAPSSSLPAGMQNRHPSVSIEEAKTALKAARAAAGTKAAGKADQMNGDSNSEDDDGSPEGSIGKSKRVLANRQSAHRSRLRKLQYIQDLESNVNRLQQELGHIQPQLTFLREKYTGLSDHNRKLRDRVAALLNEAHFKECLNNSLRQEITQLNAIQAAASGGEGVQNASVLGPSETHNVLSQQQAQAAFPSLKSQ